MLQHMSGLNIYGDIRIPDETQELLIDEDGTVSAILAGETMPVTLGQIEMATFVNPAGLRSLGGNAFAETQISGPPQLAPDDSSLHQGFLEGSNVDVAEELVAMIVAQRAYELNSKVVQAADEAMGVAANLRR